MSTSFLEEMLSNSNFSTNRPTQDRVVSIISKKDADTENETVYKAVNMLRANESASFDDFIAMTSKLVCLTMEDLEYDVKFIPQDNQDRS